MKRSGTCIAAFAALSFVLVGATAASNAAVSDREPDVIASPRPNIAYAIFKPLWLARSVHLAVWCWRATMLQCPKR